MARKTIAIIGATGKMGSALARSLSRGAYRLLLFSGQKEKAEALAGEIRKENPAADIECRLCPADASWEADIIIPAVPYAAEKELAQKISAFATRKIVVSISNPLNGDYSGLLTPSGNSAGEAMQQLLPDARVVKAFNTTYAADFGQPSINGQKVDSFIAGDDKESVETVMEMVRTAGFNPVVAGALSVSRTLEAMQLLLIQLTVRNGYNWLAGWKILH